MNSLSNLCNNIKRSNIDLIWVPGGQATEKMRQKKMSEEIKAKKYFLNLVKEIDLQVEDV